MFVILRNTYNKLIVVANKKISNYLKSATNYLELKTKPCK